MSAATILGGGFVNLRGNLRRRHPGAARPLIDFDVLLVLAPAMVAGAIAGALVNKAMPSWFTALGMAMMFGFAFCTTLRKGIQLRAEALTKEIEVAAAPQEEEEEGNRQHDGEAQDDANQTRHMHDDAMIVRSMSLMHESSWASVDHHSHGFGERQSVDVASERGERGEESAEDEERERDKESAEGEQRPLVRARADTLPSAMSVRLEDALAQQNDELVAILRSEQRTACWKVAAVSAVQLAVLVLVNLRLLTKCGGAWYWALSVAAAALCFAASVCYYAAYLRPLACRMALAGYRSVHGDTARPVEWDARKFAGVVPVAAVAGCVAAWFGTGGGTVLSPLMLSLGVVPEVGAATSATLVFFTSLASTTSYVTQDQLEVRSALVAALVGGAACFLGRLAVYRALLAGGPGPRGSRGRQHVFVFLFAAINGLSAAVLAAYFAAQALALRGKPWGAWWGVHDICTPREE